MIKSMTGYGRFEGSVDGRNAVFEIKSVNHRFFEFQCRLPKGMGFLEEGIKQLVSGYVTRGKVDVYVSIDEDENVASDVKINHSLAAGYVSAMKELRDKYGLADDISVSSIACYPDIFTVSKPQENVESLTALVQKAGKTAINEFVSMREREGEKLKADILERTRTILEYVSYIEEYSPKTVEDYRTRLYEKIKEVLSDTTIDEQRILTEAAIFADKTAVDEETVRLRSHISQLETMLSQDEPVGRKLDFIVQEMNREANTVGSKVCDTALAHKVVDIKSEIEKIREQVQNIE